MGRGRDGKKLRRSLSGHTYQREENETGVKNKSALEVGTGEEVCPMGKGKKKKGLQKP